MWTDAARAGFLLVLTTGCGVVRGPDWYGEPLFELAGEVRTDGTDLDADDLQIAMFWTRGRADGDVQYVAAETSFPSRYALQLFTPPPEDAMLPIGGLEAVRGAVGRPLLFVDEDGDGAWSVDDRIVGGSAEEVVLFVDPSSEVSGDPDAEDFAPVQPGFQRRRAPGRPCLEGVAELDVPDNAETDLLVGNVYAWFWAWECQRQSESTELAGCPPPRDMAWFCARDGDEAIDPALQTCMDRHCDTIDALVALEQLLERCVVEADGGNPCAASAPDDLPPACDNELCPRLRFVPDPDRLDTCPPSWEMAVHCVRTTSEVPTDCYALYCPVVAGIEL
jgi:hypothetical protein